MKIPKRIISKGDIVIPKGTVFECIDGMTVENVSDNYETLIGLTKENTGFFSVSFDEKNFKIMKN
jgi:hypothetical protein